MNTSDQKVMDLRTAVERFVHNGAHLSIGGFTINRNPMAAVYEIIRQGKKDLHVYAHSNGQGVDELVGGGSIKRLEIAYAGTGRFAPTCVRFRRAVQDGKLVVEDYSNYHMTLRFMAGAMGVPFLPSRSGLGSDILNITGFDEALRRQDPKLPNKKAHVLENPFGDWGETERVVLVPAIQPDVTILHVQKADTQGTVRIQGLPFSDIEQARASKRLIVTCEELVEPSELRKNPELNHIPFFCVDAVVPIPYGAYPTACYGHYDYDPVYLKEYDQVANDDLKFAEHLNRYVHKTADHDAFLHLIGQDRLSAIAADTATGYAFGLDRK